MPALAVVSMAVALLAGVTWVALAYGGRRRALAEPGARGAAAWAVAAVAVLAVAGMVVTISIDDGGEPEAGTATTAVALTSREQDGGALFRRTCASCHTLAAAGSSGEIGPNLDLVQPSADRVRRTIANGAIGYTATMPARLLTGPDARAVAAYVAKVARRFGDVPGGATRGPAGRESPGDRHDGHG
jgi:mono/diheme cytochrome c family protein